jgi:hypothetical protein
MKTLLLSFLFIAGAFFTRQIIFLKNLLIKKTTMKLIKVLMPILIICAFIQTSVAQTTETDDRIVDVAVKIIDKLNAVVKSKSSSRDGKSLSYWSYVQGIEKNDALYEFTFLSDNKGGVNPMDHRYRIDLSKILTVTMGKTRNGDDGFFFYSKAGQQAIQEYVKNHDWTVGDYKYRSDKWVDKATIFLPQDQELLEFFNEYIKLIQEDKKIHPNNYGILNEPEFYDNSASGQPLTPEARATLDAFDAISVLFGNFWEISGTASFTNPVTYESGNYNYDPTKAYELNDARFVFVYGEKKFTLNLGVGYSWMSLPSYQKLNSSGTQIDYTDFGTVQFFSPSIGFTYKFMSKENKSDYYRNVEFPLTVSFAPLFSAKTKEVTVKNEAYDTEFQKYFDGLTYNINGSIGANMYLGKGFGIGVSAGGTYVNIKASKETLTETIANSQKKFTIKMDDLTPIIPRAEVKLIFRL